MSKFTRNFTTTIEFDGDTVSITMSRLKRKQMLQLAPHMGEPDENGKVKMSLQDNVALLDAAQDKIKKNLIAMSGLFVEDGQEVVVADGKPANQELFDLIFEEAYFMNLLGEILSELVQHSFVNEEDAKKSEGPQSDTSQQ